ncbi:hypothetical protein EV715DRAFT_208634 [Schizophyllum commune]
MDFFREFSLSSVNDSSASLSSPAPSEQSSSSHGSSARHDAPLPAPDASLDDVENAPADYERSTVAFYCVVA